jgi:hypothetical protein
MGAEDKKQEINSEEIDKKFEEIEQEKEKKLLNLIVQVMVKLTLKEFYEKGDQIPEI